MEIWLVSFFGGFVGSLLMDITEARLGKLGISSGVTGTYIGRWVYSLTKGTFRHENIMNVPPVKNEMKLALVFHFVVGGGIVALFYPLFLLALGIGLNETVNHFLFATLFGLATSFLPWFVLMPSFGWGLFGSKAPNGSRPIISPILSHISYGFGIGLTVFTYYLLIA